MTKKDKLNERANGKRAGRNVADAGGERVFAFTICLTPTQILWLDDRANRLNLSRSRVVAELVAEAQKAV